MRIKQQHSVTKAKAQDRILGRVVGFPNIPSVSHLSTRHVDTRMDALVNRANMDLTADLFLDIYAGAELDESKAGDRNYGLLKYLHETDEYARVVASAHNNLTLSTFSAAKIASQIAIHNDELPETGSIPEDTKNPGGGGGTGQTPKPSDKNKDKDEDDSDEDEDDSDEDGIDPVMQAIIGGVVGDVADDVQKTKSIIESFGNSDSGDPNDVELLLDLANNDLVNRISDMVGRLEGVSTTAIQTARIEKAAFLTTYQDTRDIELVSPTDLGFVVPGLPNAFRALKIAELISKGLPGIVPITQGSKGGRMVVYLDESGSMDAPGLFDTASSISLGLCRAKMNAGIADSFSVTKFNQCLTNTITDKDSPASTMKFFSNIRGGGTSFVDVFRDILKKASEYLDDESHAGTDFLIITDGDGDYFLEDVWLIEEMKKKTGNRIISILIGGWRPKSSKQQISDFLSTNSRRVGSTEVLYLLSDTFMAIEHGELNNSDAISDALGRELAIAEIGRQELRG